MARVCISSKYKEENGGTTYQGLSCKRSWTNGPASDSEFDLMLGAIYLKMLSRAKSKWLGECLPLVKSCMEIGCQKESSLTHANTTELKTEIKESGCNSHHIFSSCNLHFPLQSSIHKNNNIYLPSVMCQQCGSRVIFKTFMYQSKLRRQ